MTARVNPAAQAPPQTPLMNRMVNWGFVILFLAAMLISYRDAHIQDLHMLVDHSANTGNYLKDYLKPDFSDWKIYTAQMWLTVEMAIWGTVMSVIMAIPLSLVCSGNLAPQWIVQPMRAIMNILRAFPELVLGTAFLVAVGLGPLAGVLALALHNTGVLAKLFSEAVEAIETAPVEGVRATGGSRLHEIVWGIIPQVAPLWTSFALYRFESNARSATILGLIGAGGIGQVLFENLQGFNYANVSAIAIVIMVAVTLIDLLSQQLRKHLV
ncbi:MAG: phosphonate ABC transporter, permease protein PhnE [Asticcacaulis sp.]